MGCSEVLAGCRGDAGVSLRPHCTRLLLFLYLGQEEVGEVGGAAGATHHPPCITLDTVAWPLKFLIWAGVSFGEGVGEAGPPAQPLQRGEAQRQAWWGLPRYNLLQMGLGNALRNTPPAVFVGVPGHIPS